MLHPKLLLSIACITCTQPGPNTGPRIPGAPLYFAGPLRAAAKEAHVHAKTEGLVSRFIWHSLELPSAIPLGPAPDPRMHIQELSGRSASQDSLYWRMSGICRRFVADGQERFVFASLNPHSHDLGICLFVTLFLSDPVESCHTATKSMKTMTRFGFAKAQRFPRSYVESKQWSSLSSSGLQ